MISMQRDQSNGDDNARRLVAMPNTTFLSAAKTDPGSFGAAHAFSGVVGSSNKDDLHPPRMSANQTSTAEASPPTQEKKGSTGGSARLGGALAVHDQRRCPSAFSAPRLGSRVQPAWCRQGWAWHLALATDADHDTWRTTASSSSSSLLRQEPRDLCLAELEMCPSIEAHL